MIKEQKRAEQLEKDLKESENPPQVEKEAEPEDKPEVEQENEPVQPAEHQEEIKKIEEKPEVEPVEENSTEVEPTEAVSANENQVCASLCVLVSELGGSGNSHVFGPKLGAYIELTVDMGVMNYAECS